MQEHQHILLQVWAACGCPHAVYNHVCIQLTTLMSAAIIEQGSGFIAYQPLAKTPGIPHIPHGGLWTKATVAVGSQQAANQGALRLTSYHDDSQLPSRYAWHPPFHDDFTTTTPSGAVKSAETRGIRANRVASVADHFPRFWIIIRKIGIGLRRRHPPIENISGKEEIFQVLQGKRTSRVTLSEVGGRVQSCDMQVGLTWLRPFCIA